MYLKHIASKALQSLRTGLVSVAMIQFAIGNCFAGAPPQSDASSGDTRTPIKHVIVIIGENRTFDHIFATYIPKSGESVWNLLSRGIINANGTPGPNFSKAKQYAASDVYPDTYLLSPPKSSFPGNVLPAPLAGGPKDSWITGDSLTLAQQSENGLPASYYKYLVSGGTGLTSKTPDTRITDVYSLPPGPFQLTNGKTFTYNSYAASPVHRFYQMWQQFDCSAKRSTSTNPSGCDARLFPWVEVTVGAGANGLPQPSNFSTEYAPGAVTTGEGSTSMGFYNMLQGDAPYFKSLADKYSISDNYHQAAMGGTGANHILLGFGDMLWFSDGKGHPEKPPHDVEVASGTANAGIVDEIEIQIPLPAPTTGTRKTATAAALMAPPRMAVVLTRTAQTFHSRALRPS